MKLLCCLSVVCLVGAARITDDLHYNKGLKTRENEESASEAVVIEASESVPVGAPLYHVPASTVLLPSLGHVSSGQRAATAYSNAFDKCVWLFTQCSGIDISDIYDPKHKPNKPNNNPRRALREAAATPAFLRYGYAAPLPATAAHYPIHGVPTTYAYGAQYPVLGAAPQPVATTYGDNFWCGLFAWKCLPDIAQIGGLAGGINPLDLLGGVLGK